MVVPIALAKRSLLTTCTPSFPLVYLFHDYSTHTPVETKRKECTLQPVPIFNELALIKRVIRKITIHRIVKFEPLRYDTRVLGR